MRPRWDPFAQSGHSPKPSLLVMAMVSCGSACKLEMGSPCGVSLWLHPGVPCGSPVGPQALEPGLRDLLLRLLDFE